jgi:hypothetical protein
LKRVIEMPHVGSREQDVGGGARHCNTASFVAGYDELAVTASVACCVHKQDGGDWMMVMAKLLKLLHAALREYGYMT